MVQLPKLTSTNQYNHAYLRVTWDSSRTQRKIIAFSFFVGIMRLSHIKSGPGKDWGWFEGFKVRKRN